MTNHRKTFWLVILFSAATGAFANEVRVAGSDLLGSGFTKAAYAFAGKHNLPLKLTLEGSKPALDALKAGRADMALMVIPVREMRNVADFRAEPIAYHAVVVVVPENSPLRETTVTELGSVFGTRGASLAVRWSDLKGGEAWRAHTIVAAAPAHGTGLTLEYFRHAVLSGSSLRPSVVRYRTTQQLVELFEGDSRAFAIAPGIPANCTTMRAVAVAMRAGTTAFLPTAEHIHAGEYPLRLGLYVVVVPDRAAAFQPMLKWLLSEEAAREFTRVDLVPLPLAAREARLLALEKR